MTNIVVKLFRVSDEAQKATSELKKAGYKVEEVSSNTKDDVKKLLTDNWHLDEETVKYYLWGISLGSVLVGVHTESSKSTKVRQILRSHESAIEKERNKTNNSPAFNQASRMSSTDPMDASMSGDFRKY